MKGGVEEVVQGHCGSVTEDQVDLLTIERVV